MSGLNLTRFFLPRRASVAIVAGRALGRAAVRVQRLGRLSAICIGAVLTTGNATAAPERLSDHCWDQTFVDNFDVLKLEDPATGQTGWKTAYIWPRDVIINNEMQYYVDPDIHGVNPFSINDGVLRISATKTPSALLPKVAQQPYLSGVLTTENGFSQQYGRFEARLKVPRGKGLWSAFWLLPSFDQWPKGIAILPEIDVMEAIGHELRSFHTTLHTNQTGKLTSHPYDHTVPPVLSDDFHLFSVVWTPDNVTWYFDRQQMAQHPTPKDFTRPVHFLLNLAVGGSWPGEPDNRTRFPAHFDIDYVKAWRTNGSCD